MCSGCCTYESSDRASGMLPALCMSENKNYHWHGVAWHGMAPYWPTILLLGAGDEGCSAIVNHEQPARSSPGRRSSMVYCNQAPPGLQPASKPRTLRLTDASMLLCFKPARFLCAVQFALMDTLSLAPEPPPPVGNASPQAPLMAPRPPARAPAPQPPSMTPAQAAVSCWHSLGCLCVERPG